METLLTVLGVVMGGLLACMWLLPECLELRGDSRRAEEQRRAENPRRSSDAAPTGCAERPARRRAA